MGKFLLVNMFLNSPISHAYVINSEFMGECVIPVSTIAKFGERTNMSYSLYKDGQKCGRVRLRISFDTEDSMNAESEKKVWKYYLIDCFEN